VLAGALTASSASAEGFVNPFIGYHFGQDSACPSFSQCEKQDLQLGVSAGALGPILGFEVDLGLGKDFFASAPNFEGSVTTLMRNVLLAPKMGSVGPYGLVGIGLVRTHAEVTGVVNVPVSNNNQFGFDFGGGIMIFFGRHFGVRGDIRGFKSLQDLEV